MHNENAKDKLIRLSITIPESLLSEFEASYYAENLPNRSEAVRNLMRSYISSERWQCSDGEVCATITIVYDHHLPDVTRELTAVQHDYGEVIVCSTHVHLSHEICLECVITKGQAQAIRELLEALGKIRGIKSLNVNVTVGL